MFDGFLFVGKYFLDCCGELLRLHDACHVGSGNNVVKQHALLIDWENVRDVDLVVVVDFIDNNALNILKFLFDHVDGVALHAVELLEQVMIDVERVLAVFEFGDYFFVEVALFLRLVDDVQDDVFEDAVELVIEPMHRDTAEHLIGYFTIDLQVLRLHVFLLADLGHNFFYDQSD